MLWSDTFRRWLPAFGTAIPLIILPIAVLSIPLAAAQEMRLSAPETTSWILALYGLSGLLGLLLTIRYRQPLLLTGNIFVLIFIASLGSRLSYPELVGASIVAGASVVLLSALGLTARLAAWIPAPIVLGLLAGAVMPFVSDIFTSLGDAPALVGGTVLVYFVSRRVLGSRLPAILPALVAGLAIAALTGEIGQVPARLSLPIPSVTNPVFSVHAIATATPVLVILITLQSNLPSVVFLQNEGYHPPERVINNVSGVSTLLGSLLGPTAVSLSLPATALVAGPQAGEHQLRHRAVYLASGAVLLIALLAGIAADHPRPLAAWADVRIRDRPLRDFDPWLWSLLLGARHWHRYFVFARTRQAARVTLTCAHGRGAFRIVGEVNEVNSLLHGTTAMPRVRNPVASPPKRAAAGFVSLHEGYLAARS